MKIITLGLAFMLSMALCAQTNVISNKSHSGDLSELYLEPDDFGAVYMPPIIDSVILHSSTCIIEVKRSIYFIEDSGAQTYRDTICNNYFLPINKTEFAEFKKKYPKKTKFIGFEKVEKSSTLRGNYFKQNSISFFFGIIILLIALYSFLPLLRKKA